MVAHQGKLTAKQQCFVEEYLIDLNATQAAIRAGYSENSAQEQSSRLLSNVMVEEAVSKTIKKRSDKTGVTINQVVTGLLTEAQGGVDDSTPASRVSAWGLLGRHLGMFVDRVDQRTTYEAGDTLAQLLKEIDGNSRTVKIKELRSQ